MGLSDSDYPWVFHRDEVDLLEDQVEDLYERHNRSCDESSMEQDVLSEQLKTEELFELKLKDKLEQDFLVRGSSVPSLTEQSQETVNDEMSIRFRREAFRQPLYVHARKWAASVFTHTRTCYETENRRTRDMFRVYVNVNLVPIKIIVGITEEMRDDPLGREMALQEYGLAQAYLGRVIESLHKILPQETDVQKVFEMIAVARQISGSLSQRERELKRRQQGSNTLYG